MKVYLYEIELSFTKVGSPLPGEYDAVIEEGNEGAIRTSSGRVLYRSVDFEMLSRLLDHLQEKSPKGLTSVTIPEDNKEKVKSFLKKRYHYIKAAGGLVVKDRNYLFIYRLKRWDLPKGKLEKGEDIKACALREVEEECSVKATVISKIGSTWHLYPTKSGWNVKKSTWYLMSCLDDSLMKPQVQEDIEDIVWVSQENISKYLNNSYGTIRDVFFKAKKKGII